MHNARLVVSRFSCKIFLALFPLCIFIELSCLHTRRVPIAVIWRLPNRIAVVKFFAGDCRNTRSLILIGARATRGRRGYVPPLFTNLDIRYPFSAYIFPLSYFESAPECITPHFWILPTSQLLLIKFLMCRRFVMISILRTDLMWMILSHGLCFPYMTSEKGVIWHIAHGPQDPWGLTTPNSWRSGEPHKVNQ